MSSVVKLQECFEKNSLLTSFTKSESQPNTLAWLGLSALLQGGISCIAWNWGGSPGVAFEVVPP